MHACIMSQANKKKTLPWAGEMARSVDSCYKGINKILLKKKPGIVLSSSSLGAEETDAHWLWHAQPT